MKNINQGAKKNENVTKNIKPVDKNILNTDNVDKENNTNKEVFTQHPRREENLSSLIITPETHRIITDELLTKEDEVSMLEFNKLKSIISSNQPVKIDYVEILDDKWASFSK